MKRIIIYVHNEDMEALKPLRQRLERAGAMVNFHALKYPEVVKADQVLTKSAYLKTVKAIFAGTDVPVVEIDEEDNAVEIVATPEPEAVAEQPPLTYSDDEAIVITVGETPAPPVAAPPRGRRK